MLEPQRQPTKKQLFGAVGGGTGAKRLRLPPPPVPLHAAAAARSIHVGKVQALACCAVPPAAFPALAAGPAAAAAAPNPPSGWTAWQSAGAGNGAQAPVIALKPAPPSPQKLQATLLRSLPR